MKKLLGLACLLVFASCGSAPVPRQIQKVFPVDQPFDTVWVAVIEIFAELNLPIINMEKASGLITTDWIRWDDPEASDCGGEGPVYADRERRVKFNVFVKKVTEDSAEMMVNAVFERLTLGLWNDPPDISPCYSTGKFEKEIYDRVVAKAK